MEKCNDLTDARYCASDPMIRLIADDYQLIQVMSRFGIRMGFADKSVAEVCAECGVDCNTFLTVVNFVADGSAVLHSSPKVSVLSLLDYLRQSHSYFLEYYLPAIRGKLMRGIQVNSGDISFLIIKFFDDYMAEVRTHMDYEDRTVFTNVMSLIDGVVPDNFTITTYSDHHEEVSSKLTELKRLIIKYCPPCADTNLLNDALYDIYRCEQELESHCLIEDHILVPALVKLEQEVKGSQKHAGA